MVTDDFRGEDFRPLGSHMIQVDGDLVFMRVKGMMTLRDMKEHLALLAQVQQTTGVIFMLYDSRENTGLEPAARKFATDTSRLATGVRVAASFGAPFGVRVVVNMINRALDALGKPGTRTRLFDTEVQARQYLEAERARLRSSA